MLLRLKLSLDFVTDSYSACGFVLEGRSRSSELVMPSLWKKTRGKLRRFIQSYNPQLIFSKTTNERPRNNRWNITHCCPGKYLSMQNPIQLKRSLRSGVNLSCHTTEVRVGRISIVIGWWTISSDQMAVWYRKAFENRDMYACNIDFEFCLENVGIGESFPITSLFCISLSNH